jgi:hypothetical protein
LDIRLKAALWFSQFIHPRPQLALDVPPGGLMITPNYLQMDAGITERA